MSSRRTKLRLIVSYAFDWIVLAVLAGVGGALNYINGYHRPFSLTDTSLAFPSRPNTVSITVVGIIAFAAPALIIAVSCMVIPPRPLPASATRAATWRRRIWDVNAGWLGLALSLALTLFVTAGLKDVIGKPRPDLLARCNADVANIREWIVGGFGTSLNSEASALVGSGICRQPNRRLLDDGFAAFPSGHSSFSWAGLLYLTLWLCSRFSIAIPDLASASLAQNGSSKGFDLAYTRTRQAAPPLWITLIAIFPCGVALFICSSRYADFHHAGFDIIAGSAIGILFAWAGFRTYHLPLRQGVGTSWGPRSDGHVFSAFQNAEDVGTGFVTSSRSWQGLQNQENAQSHRMQTGESGEEMVTYINNRAVGTENV